MEPTGGDGSEDNDHGGKQEDSSEGEEEEGFERQPEKSQGSEDLTQAGDGGEESDSAFPPRHTPVPKDEIEDVAPDQLRDVTRAQRDTSSPLENDSDDDGTNDDGDKEDSEDENGREDDDDDDDNSSKDDADSSRSASSSSSDDASSEDEAADGAATTTTTSKRKVIIRDGRELSEYEILRLERIQRNKEYLANLGLEKREGHDGGFLGDRKPKPRPKKKRVAPRPPSDTIAAQRPSRRAKEAVNYAEPKCGIAAMAREPEQCKANATDGNDDLQIQETPGKRDAATPSSPSSRNKEKAAKRPEERMEKFLYLEYRSIQSHKNGVLRQAERNVRAAEKAVKYWGRLAEKAERRATRKRLKEEEARVLGQMAAELREQREKMKKKQKESTGCRTIKQLLKEVDQRMPELRSAVEKYDAELGVSVVIQPFQ